MKLPFNHSIVLLGAGLAIALGSCSWSKFDDLKDDAWVQLVERDESGTTGDFGIDVASVETASGAMGASFVASAGGTAGLAQATFNEKGDRTALIGYDGDQSGSGQIKPIKTTQSTPFSILAYDSTTFLVGLPERSIVAKLETGLKNGEAILEDTGLPRAGDSLAIGNLGLSSAKPDVVTVGSSFLTVIPGGDRTRPTLNCALAQPAKNNNAPVVPLENVKVGRMDAGAGPQQIVVAGFDADNGQPRIFILDASQVQAANRGPCPVSSSFIVDSPPPGSIQLADLDENGALDIIAGALGTTAGSTGSVRVYLNPTRTSGTKMEIPSMTDETSSNLRGSRIRVGDVDNDGELEIVVGDATASPDGVSAAGQVQMYRWGTAGCGGQVRGPACLVRTIFDSEPSRNGFFGRALAIAPFKAGSSTKNILAVTQKDMALVYFRVAASETDPRVP